MEGGVVTGLQGGACCINILEVDAETEYIQ